jgi:UDP-N-acetylmuramate--alanine ligase
MTKIFLSGIGGSGLSAIAGYLSDKGNDVWGSDRAFDMDKKHPLVKPLIQKGIKIVPQDGKSIDKTFDFVIFSTSVESSNPEYIKTQSLGIMTKARPQFLVELTNDIKTVAVSGTSGKSTTSGMLSFLLKSLGVNPDFIGGGRVKKFKSLNGLGNYLSGSGNTLVIEACESDGSIVNYKPYYTILLNIELDHHPLSITSNMFQSLIQNTKERVVINADDSNIMALKVKEPVTFSIDRPSDFRAEQIDYKHFSTEFTLKGMRFRLSIPGKHNLYNALSCIALLVEMGFSLNKIAEILPDFDGIERRLDIVYNDGTNLVIDDYAHNPHKISCLIATVTKMSDSICYIFQPHGYGPTRLMKDEYIRVFSEGLRRNDHLIILPIYYQGGTAQRDISSHDLKNGIKKYNKSVEVVENRKDVINKMKNWDTFVIFGARDESLSTFARYLSDKISNEKLC